MGISNRVSHLRRRRRESAMVSIHVITMALLLTVGFLGISLFVSNQLVSTRAARDRYSALLMAEAGLEAANQRILADKTFTGESATLTHETSGTFGSYITTVAKIDDYHYRVNSTGTYVGGVSKKVAAVVALNRRELGSAAIIANGDVTITGTADIRTTPLSQHVADVLANGNITLTGAATVDGQLQAQGTVSAASGSNQGTVSGADPIEFPDTTTTNQWETAWIAAAQAGGTRNAINNSNTTVQAPKYINGDIKLTSSKSVTISGPGVVYVNGDVDLGAQCTLVNGATLVVKGTFNQAGQSIYKIDTTVTSPTPSLIVFGNKTADATTTTTSLMGGASTDSEGIVYVLYGKLKVGGNSVFTGSFVINQGGVDVQVVGTYQHYFPVDYAPPVNFPNQIGIKYVIEL